MSINMIDDIFTQYGGATGWVSGEKEIVINPNCFPFPLDTFLNELKATVSLYNTCFRAANFNAASIKVDDKATHNHDNEFILIDFEKVVLSPGAHVGRLANSTLQYTGPGGFWKGGHIRLYGPDQAWTNQNWSFTLRKILNHEFGHMCGVGHCNSIWKSMMQGNKVTEPLNASGFLPSDLAYIQKTLLGYEDGEVIVGIDINAHVIYTQATFNGNYFGLLYIPYILHPNSQKPFCGILTCHNQFTIINERYVPVFQQEFFSSFDDLPFPDYWRYDWNSGATIAADLNRIDLYDVYADTKQKFLPHVVLEYIKGIGWAVILPILE